MMIAPTWYLRDGSNPVPKPTNASFTFPALNCKLADCVRIQITGAATGAPNFSFKFQGSESPYLVETDLNNSSALALWTDLTLPAGCVHGTSSDIVFAGPGSTFTWGGAATLNVLVDLSKPPTWIRLVATNTAAGSATASLLASVGMRGPEI